MHVVETPLPKVTIIEPRIFGDPRGCFLETYHEARYREAGITDSFVQDNISVSTRGVLRGLHFQWPDPQAKLVTVLRGQVYDVAVDIRVGSPTFGKAFGVILSEENRRQLYVPEGFAHGFCVTSEVAVFSYKCSAFYAPEHEGGILYSDPALGIDWPVRAPKVSPKDANYPRLQDIDPERLPRYRVRNVL